MYSTVSGNGRDNSSVYSGGSSNTGHRRVIPRSNSTSDLYEIPSTGSGGSRKKRQPYVANVVQGSSGTPGSRMAPRAYSWTGTDRGQLGGQSVPLKQNPHHIPQYKQQQQHTVRQGMYKSQSKSNSSYSLEPKKSLNAIPERRQPSYVLTPYQLQRKQMKGSFQFPNGENFTPRSRLGGGLPRSNSSTALNQKGGPPLQTLSRSQSMNSLPLKQPKVQKPLMVVTSSTSPVESGSSNSSYNSMRDHSSSGSTNLSSGPSAHSSNTALPLTANAKAQSAMMVLRVGANSEARTNAASPVTNSRGKPTVAETAMRDSSPKRQSRSGTKLGAFFKRIFSLSSSNTPSPSSSASSSSTSLVSLSQLSPLNLSRRKKRKRIDAVSSSRCDETPVSSKQKLSVDKETDEPVKGFEDHKRGAEIQLPVEDDENDEDSDDILMDTDLVFDSLLLKADTSRPSYQQKQVELRQKLKDLPKSDSASTINELDTTPEQTPKEAESNIDYELISEFSRLGSFIEDSSKLASLPPRSAKRPTLPDKEVAKSFYHPVYGETDHCLIKRLYRDWKVVQIDKSFHEVDVKAAPGKKGLRFADEIYVNDTWSKFDYQRSDKRFIKNRRRMMQLENEGFIRDIKVELNEYKRSEMHVHQESVRFTHFFL